MDPRLRSVAVERTHCGRGRIARLGRSHRARFARGGHPVAIAGRNAQKFQAIASELKDAGATDLYRWRCSAR
jgi:hypothetical protein